MCYESGGDVGPHPFTMGVSQPSKRVQKKADRKGHSSRQKGTRSTRTMDAAPSSKDPAPPQVAPSAASLPCTCFECLQGSLHAYHPCPRCLWARQTRYAAHHVTTISTSCSINGRRQLVMLHSTGCAGEVTFIKESQDL